MVKTRSILKEKQKEEIIVKLRDAVFDVKKTTVGMPTGIGDKARAGWHLPVQAPPTDVEHKVAPGTADGMRRGRELLPQGIKMPVLAVEGPIENLKVPAETGITRMVGSEGETPKVKKLTIWEKLFGVKKEVGEVTPQYQPATKVYRGRAKKRRTSNK